MNEREEKKRKKVNVRSTGRKYTKQTVVSTFSI